MSKYSIQDLIRIVSKIYNANVTCAQFEITTEDFPPKPVQQITCKLANLVTLTLKVKIPMAEKKNIIMISFHHTTLKHLSENPKCRKNNVFFLLSCDLENIDYNPCGKGWHASRHPKLLTTFISRKYMVVWHFGKTSRDFHFMPLS